MTTADMDKMGFTHEEDNELVEYRSLSRWALAAAVFGVFSATALATPLLWVVPLVAVVIGLYMVVHTKLTEGPEITISFATAEGLEAGKTKLRGYFVGQVMKRTQGRANPRVLNELLDRLLDPDAPEG